MNEDEPKLEDVIASIPWSSIIIPLVLSIVIAAVFIFLTLKEKV